MVLHLTGLALSVTPIRDAVDKRSADGVSLRAVSRISRLIRHDNDDDGSCSSSSSSRFCVNMNTVRAKFLIRPDAVTSAAESITTFAKVKKIRLY